TFAGGVTGGNHALTVTSMGAIAFGTFGTVSGLTSLTTTSPTSTTIGSNITTTNGAITINGPTIVGNNFPGYTLSTGTGAVAFKGAVNGDTTVGGNFLLTINNTGGTTFESTIGATRPLTSLTTTGGGATTFDGSVTISNGTVSIGGTTTLGGDVTVSTGTGSVTFTGAVSG